MRAGDYTAADYAAEVEHLLSLGESPTAIAGALRRDVAAIARGLYRAQRPDLARVFERARRPHTCACGARIGPHATTCASCYQAGTKTAERDRAGRFTSTHRVRQETRAA